MKSQEFLYNLAFVAIVKNEAPYIREWILFHKLVGVEHFYIYDNESSDHLRQELQCFIETGIVEYIYYPGLKMQLPAYKDAILKHKYETKYLGFIDIDEFVIPLLHENLIDTIDDIMLLDDHAAGVAINWRMYGSSGFMQKNNGLVSDIYQFRATDEFMPNNHIKTICNPRFVIDFQNPHFPKYVDDMHNINEDGKAVLGPFNPDCSCKKIRINHYFTKSKQEYIAKMNRGKADSLEKRSLNEFYAHDQNDIYDYIMEKYVRMILQENEFMNEIRAITIADDEKYLRQISKVVALDDPNLNNDIAILEKFCLENEVMAMSAVQIGIPKRLIYLKNTNLDIINKKQTNSTTKEEELYNEARVLINPVILSREGLTDYWEACASCLDNFGHIKRPYKIKVAYEDIHKKHHTDIFEGFESTVLSHEMDHLDGILHMDIADEVLIMPKEERKNFRKNHGYHIVSKTGNFEELLLVKHKNSI